LSEADALEPVDETLVVIVAEDDGGLVCLTDGEHDDEAAVYLSGDPEIPGLVEAARKVYGASARAMPVREFGALAQSAVASPGAEPS
jgi:hypothetical protein